MDYAANSRFIKINSLFARRRTGGAVITSREKAVIAAGLAMVLAIMLPVAQGQEQGGVEELGEIVVTSPRVEKELVKVPAAIGVVDQDDIQLGTQQLGLDESLVKVPGVFMLNRYNFTQDLRIAIRGFGARANFGIRGIKLYADDIPLTLPDGQGGVDNIDLSSAERIEVIRGPSSSLYGTSSGGVINIYTEEGPATPFVEGRYSFGEYDFMKYNLKAGGQKDQLNYLVNVGRYELEGYRDHSRTESALLNSKFRYMIDGTSDLTAVINVVDSPVADDPGALTAAEVRANRKQAAPAALRFDGGELLEQHQIGLVYRKLLGDKHEVRLRNYYVFREFENKLAFRPGGQVFFNRFFFGGGGQYIFHGDSNRFTFGFDLDAQNDDRKRFNNENGALGALTLNQDEDVVSIGFYAQNEYRLTETVELTTGIRYDKIEFEVNDSFLANGDDSGIIQFDNMSPMFGLLWGPRPELNIYGNISTAYETPSTTEFANPAAGGTAGGFNQNLKPQTAINSEVGVKGTLPWWSTYYDLAVFHIKVEDELVPFELPGLPGRSFFNNAGESERDGLEVLLSARPLSGLTASFTYTYSAFEFESFRVVDAGGGVTVFDGNDILGIPRHFGNFEVTYFHSTGFYGIWNTQLVGPFFADNANSVEVDGYGVSNLRFGYVRDIGGVELSPFVGINNIFDKEYNANIRINAGFGRFFEPAPDMNAYAGLSLRWSY
jgi:iron complex outermembrane receptor protein